jgi:uncharacterized protein YjiS (DUF1127 family)
MVLIAESFGGTAGRERKFGIFKRLRMAVLRRRMYKQTYAALSALTTRELDDLGIHRSMISRVASEAASKV